MNRELANYLSQISDDDQEIRKLGINGIAELELESLDPEDLEALKTKLTPMLEDANLTIRYFAKKTLKRLAEPAADTPVQNSAPQQETPFFIPMAGQEDLTPKRTLSKHTGDEIDVELPQEDELQAALAKQQAEDSALDTQLQGGDTAPARQEKSPAARKKTPVAAKKGKAPVSRTGKVAGPAFPAYLAAWINILFFLGLSYESLHYKIMTQSFPKMITSDLEGQVVFGLLLFYGLSNLFLRSRITAMGSSRLAAISSTVMISTACWKGAASLQILGADASYLAATLPVIMGTAAMGYVWEGGAGLKLIKIPLTLVGLYGISGGVLHLASGIAPAPSDPFLLDAPVTLHLGAVPALASPTFALTHYLIPLVLLKVAWEILAGLFKMDLDRFSGSLLALLLFFAPLVASFFLFPMSATSVYNVRNLVTDGWVLLHEKTSQPLLAPPAWLTGTSDEAAGTGENSDSEKPEVQKPHAPAENSDNNAATGPSKDTSFPETSALPEVQSDPTDVGSFVDSRIKNFLAANNNIISRDQFTKLSLQITQEYDDSAKKAGIKANVRAAACTETLSAWEAKLFEKAVAPINSDEQALREGCMQNLQKIGGAVESYNFNQPSEDLYMKNLDFNQLYPKHLDSIPQCSAGGNYSINDKGEPVCSKHGVLAR